MQKAYGRRNQVFFAASAAQFKEEQLQQVRMTNRKLRLIVKDNVSRMQ